MPQHKRRNQESERRRIRREVERCYREYTPPQIRHLRQVRWMERVNPNPKGV
jgi:hypothetical protein